MQTVSISDFRANLLKYLELAGSGEEISVTSNGRLLATVCAPMPQKEAAREELRKMAGSSVIGDVVSPIDEDWEAQA